MERTCRSQPRLAPSHMAAANNKDEDAATTKKKDMRSACGATGAVAFVVSTSMSAGGWDWSGAHHDVSARDCPRLDVSESLGVFKVVARCSWGDDAR